MAKKITQDTVTLKLPLPVFSLWCKMGKRYLLPSIAFDKEYWKALTQCKTRADMDCVKDATWRTYDGKLVKVKFISSYNNQNNYHINELDKLCREIFGNEVDFARLKEAWYNRSKTKEDYWHVVELEEA